MLIRQANSEDAYGIAKVHVISWQKAYQDIIAADFLAALNVIDRARAWLPILGQESSVYVAESGTQVIEGFVHLCPCRDPEMAGQSVGEVASLYINPELVGTGLGSSLMKFALNELAARGFGVVTLWVLAKNKRAIQFYEKSGFKPDGAAKPHPRLDVVELRYKFENGL